MKRLTITLFTLICLTPGAAVTQGNASSQQEPQVDGGKINGANYRIEMPAAWNKGLVIYCHGCEVKGTPAGNADNPFAKAIRNVFLSRGFAFAESAYSTQGWAVREAVEDTEAMRRYFVTTYGQPRETIVTGHSMAGTQDMFVQKFVAADGHCNINAARTAAAFDSLLVWIREKKRPAAGELQ
ncbi:MAG: DUF6351 family protein [Blastocatellia bacterium]